MSALVVEVLLIALREEVRTAIRSSSELCSGVSLHIRDTVSISTICPLPKRTDVAELWVCQSDSDSEISYYLSCLERFPCLRIVLQTTTSPHGPLDALPLHVARRLEVVRGDTAHLQRRIRNVVHSIELEARVAWERESRKVINQVLRHMSARRVSTRTMQWLLAKFGTLLNVDRSYYCRFSPQCGVISVLHEWCAKDIPSQKHRLDNAPSSSFGWFADEMRAGRAVVLQSLEDLPREAFAERVELSFEEVTALVCVPILQKRRAVGFIGVSMVSGARNWTSSEIDFVQTISSVIAAIGSGEELLAEHAMERELFASALHALDDGVAILDARDQTVFCNAAMQARLDELALPSVDVDRILSSQVSSAKEILPRGVGVPIDATTFQTNDGVIISFEKKPLALQISEGAGASAHLMYLARDVTAAHAASQRLLRTQKLEALGRLASGVSHDFNNLLTAILGYVGLLLQKYPEGTGVFPELEQVQKSALQASELAKQLLLFASSKEITSSCDPNKVIEETIASILGLVGEHIRIRQARLAKNCSTAIGPVQFQQIVLNLVLNARDAMPNGGEISIRSSIDSTPEVGRSSFVLEVEDTGVGMSPEVQRQIFEPFFTTKERTGTGLGLATVSQIVEDHGGLIAVQSRTNCGTTFRVVLPIAEQQGSLIETRTAPKGSAHGSILVGGSETILVVEDDPAVRALIKEILELAGYSVVLAEHGRQALLIVEEYAARIDAVIADVVMPFIGGVELVERLRVLRPRIKCMLISGYHTNWGATSTRNAVADNAFLSKPFLPTEFLSRLRAVLEADILAVPTGVGEVRYASDSDKVYDNSYTALNIATSCAAPSRNSSAAILSKPLTAKKPTGVAKNVVEPKG